LRLLKALERGDGLDKPHTNARTQETLVAQTGAEDPALVRLAARETGSLLPNKMQYGPSSSAASSPNAITTAFKTL
jgi:hypothetical protein